jgi:hypothetical protein
MGQFLHKLANGANLGRFRQKGQLIQVFGGLLGQRFGFRQGY